MEASSPSMVGHVLTVSIAEDSLDSRRFNLSCNDLAPSEGGGSVLGEPDSDMEDKWMCVCIFWSHVPAVLVSSGR